MTDIEIEKLKIYDDMVLVMKSNCANCDFNGFHPCESCGQYKFIEQVKKIEWMPK